MEKKKALETVKKFGGAMKQVLIASASHPVTAALAIMGVTTIINTIVDLSDPQQKSRRSVSVKHHIGGLYSSAERLGATAAVVPVVTGAISLVKAAVVSRAEKEED